MAKSYRNDIHGGVPYYDDYDENKKFLRIMSRPGFPLQAREITQLQTILQNQIERLGDHFFEEGAVVRGGEITESSSIAVRLDNTGTIFTEEQLKSFLGKTIRNNSGVQATIVAYADRSTTYQDDGYQIFFANYTTGSNFSAGETLTIQETLPVIEVSIKSNNTNEPPAIAQASNIVSIAEGFFYADGFLLKSDAGTIAASSSTATSAGGAIYRDYVNPSTSVGFRIEREIVTADQDETLKDPSFGFYNFNSPGADRYKVELKLDQIPLTETNRESFFELVRIDQGNTTKQVRYTDYAIFEETLARRTYDESGHYTVSPFQVTTLTHQDAFGTENEDFHAIQISSGKAYVNGYEFETIVPSYFPIERANGEDHQETLRVVTLNTPSKNYVTIEAEFNAWGPVTDTDRDMFTNQRAANIERRNEDGTFETIGTCNIRTIQEMAIGANEDYNEVRGEFRLFLFNIRMNEGKRFKDLTDISVQDGTVGSDDNKTNRFRLSEPNLDVLLKNPGSSRQIFKAPIGSGLIKTNRDDLPSQFIVKKPYNFEMSGSSATVTSEFPFLDSNYTNYVVYYGNNASGAGATMLRVGVDLNLQINNNASPKTLTISIPSGSIAQPNGQGTVIATQRWVSESTNPENNIRTKTLVETELTTPSLGGEVGSDDETIVVLDHADVYEVTSITDEFGDVTDRFDLDVNHTNEAYYNSRLILKAGFTCGTDADTGKLKLNTVSYKRFSHAGNGPFTVDSYPITDNFTYDDIPVFTDTETGEKYSLADAFDFRPVAVSDENARFDNGSGEPQVVAMPSPAFGSFVSYVHYMPRIDKLVIDSDRTFKLIQGIPSNTPVAPQTQVTQMTLGEFKVPAYTVSPDDIKYRHIDNQRTTMSGINEIEQTQQYDQYWAYTRDLEARAISQAKAFKPEYFVGSNNTVFVDTFIGHNNTVTSVRDHNCSIDPEDGTLRPAFESSFHHMGLTGAELGSNTKKTSDNIYMLTHDTTIYTSNVLSSDTIKVNQFGIPDFLGTLQLSPSSDPYFSTIIKPKVMVNIVGEVDNWESNIVAYQRGRTRGFGSQWRDWETLWFGSRKRNDINIEHSSSGSDYSAPKRSSFVSRILSDKITRKIGDKIVDLSVVPYARSRTITFTAKNLKPNTIHSVYFEGTRVVQAVSTNENGEATGSFDISSRTFLTGKKLVRIQDQASLVISSSSADAIYHAEGLLDTRSNDIFSARPAITRRKASNTEDVSEDYYEANADGNLSPVLNSVTPFAQEIYIDPTNFRNGLMLSDITLFFAKKPTAEQQAANKPPVKLSIRPMYQGSPHPYKVLPFSEVTKNLDDVVVVSDHNATEATGGTNFEFSTPVYLRPGKSYAICISANSTDYELYMGVEGSRARGIDGNELVPVSTVIRPRYIRQMHLPLNNGQSYSVLDQYLKMNINRCVFDVDSTLTTIKFKTNLTQTKPAHALYFHTNEQVNQNVRLTNLLTGETVAGGLDTRRINFNETLSLQLTEKYIITENQQLEVSSLLLPDAGTEAVSPMIDGDRFGVVAIEYMANNDDAAAIVEELSPTSRVATNRSRYISRKVTLDTTAHNIAAFVEGSFLGESKVRVFAKIQGPDTPSGNFDDNNWIELVPEGDSSTPFSEVKPQGLTPGVVRFISEGSENIGAFNQYQIKVVLMGDDAQNSGNASQVPIIQSVSAVPLRDPTLTEEGQDIIRRSIPVGTILPYAGNITTDNPVPSGFLLCDGGLYSRIGDYASLFARIGTTYNTGGESSTHFRVPDLRSRVPLGSDGSNELASRGGANTFTLSSSQLPEHTHQFGLGDLTQEDPILRNTVMDFNILTSTGFEQTTEPADEVYHLIAKRYESFGINPNEDIAPLGSVSGFAYQNQAPYQAGTNLKGVAIPTKIAETVEGQQINLQANYLQDYGLRPVAGFRPDPYFDVNGMKNDPIDIRQPYLAINYIIKL